MEKTLKKIKKILEKHSPESDVKVIDLVGLGSGDESYQIVCYTREEVKRLSRAICKKFNSEPIRVGFGDRGLDGRVDIIIHFSETNISILYEAYTDDVITKIFGRLY